MMDERKVQIRLPDGSVKRVTLQWSNDPWHVSLTELPSGEMHAVGNSLFAAVSNLRLELEQNGMLLLCNAARPDVYPSGMSISMGGGRKAYLTRLNEPAVELLDILDYAPPESIGTVAEQLAFHREWIESIRHR